MLLAEGFETASEVVDHLLARADCQSEAVLGEEALRWEDHAVLVGEKLLAEVDIVGDTLENLRVKHTEQVHSGLCLHRSDTLDLANSFVGVSRCLTELALQILKERFRNGLEDLRKSSLDQRSWVQLDHSVLAKVV